MPGSDVARVFPIVSMRFALARRYPLGEMGWKATSPCCPAPGRADWRELRRDGEAVEFHAATVPLELHRAETEAYPSRLDAPVPSVWVILRPPGG